MALQKQKIPLSLVSGMDTKTDEFNSVSFKLIENFRYNKPGALTKVAGYDTYTTNLKTLASNQPTISDGSAIYSLKNELLLNTSSQLLSYSEVSNNWVSKNYLNVNNTAYANAVNNSGITYVKSEEFNSLEYLDRDTVPDYYTNSNYSATIAVDPTLAGIKIQVVENSDNIKIIDSFIPNLSSFPFNKLAATNTKAKIAGIYNNKLYIVTYVFLSGSILIYEYDLVNPNNLPVTYSKTFDYFEICTMDETTGTIYVSGFTGTTTLPVGKFVISTGVFTSTNHVLAVDLNPKFIDILNTNSSLRITGDDAGVVYSLVISQSTLAITVSLLTWATAFHYTTANDGNNTYLIYAEGISSSAGSPYGSGSYIKAMNAAGTTNILSGTFTISGFSKITGKALYDSGLIYFNSVQGQVNTVSAFVPVSYVNATLITSKINLSLVNANYNAELIGQSGYFNTVAWYENLKIFKISNTLQFANILLAEFYSTSAGEVQKNKVITVKHEILSSKTKEVNTQNYIFIPTSIPKIYDGRYLTEAGFITSPHFINAVDFTDIGAGTAFPMGTYGLAAVYRWKDNNGAINFSIPQFISFAVGIANLKRISVEVQTLGLTSKDDVYIDFFVATPGETVYRKIAIEVINNKYVGKKSVDIYALNVLNVSSNEVLYTTSGFLENDLASSSKASASFKDRIFYASSNVLNYTKIIQPNTPIEFSALFTVNPNLNNKDVVTIQEMDNVLAIFGQNSISILAGEGPNDLGEQNDYRTPQQISSDVGATDMNSVVATPEGILFKSEKGIYMLNRGLYVTYIGAPVEQYNSQQVLDAILLNDTNEVRFLLSDKILSYDYIAKQWSVLTNISASAVDSVIHNDTYHYLKSNGVVYSQNDAVFTSAGSYYSAKFETNWITVGSINVNGSMQTSAQGFQRLYTINVLGKYRSAHNLKVSLAYNYSDTVVDYATIVPTGVGVYQFEVKPSLQKCEAFKIIVEDVSQAGTGESMVISHILLEVGIKGSAQKVLADSKRFAAT